MKWGRTLILLIVVIISITGCAVNNNKNDHQIELVISAASSLTDALYEIKESFEEKNKDITITYSFGGSGKLAQQIVYGAPVDIFLSASEEFMDQLKEKDLILKESYRHIASNDLVLATKKDNNLSIYSFEQLNTTPIQQIAIGNPDSVPAGKYAKEVFTHLGLWNKLEQKTIYTKDVRQVLTYIESGNVELGIVYKSDILSSDGIKIVAIANPNWYSPISYPGAIMKESEHPTEARKFMEFLENEGKDILKKNGFK